MEIDKVKGYLVSSLQLLVPPPLEAAAPAPPLSPTPSPDLPQLLSFLLACLDPKVESDPTHILRAAVKETMGNTLQNLQADLRKEGLYKTLQLASSDESSCWWPYDQISHAPCSSHFLFVLQRYSEALCVLLSPTLSAAPNPHSLLETVQEVWKESEEDLIQLANSFQLDSDPEWSSCLATLGVSMLVSQVNAAMAQSLDAKQAEQAQLHGGGVSRILDILNERFPSALHRKCQKWEEQEVGGGGELVSTRQGGLILKVRQGVFSLSILSIFSL